MGNQNQPTSQWCDNTTQRTQFRARVAIEFGQITQIENLGGDLFGFLGKCSFTGEAERSTCHRHLPLPSRANRGDAGTAQDEPARLVALENSPADDP